MTFFSPLIDVCSSFDEQQSDSQALAALSTARIDDLTAVLGAHAGQKSVNFLALTLLRLKSSLHNEILQKLVPGVQGLRFNAPEQNWGQACNTRVYPNVLRPVKFLFCFLPCFLKEIYENGRVFNFFQK